MSERIGRVDLRQVLYGSENGRRDAEYIGPEAERGGVRDEECGGGYDDDEAM